jgi:hypothetical protein
VATTRDKPASAQYVQAVNVVFENVYNVENVQMGWKTPIPDGTRGGDSRTDVYIKNIGPEGIFGYAAPEQGSVSSYAYLVMDDDYAHAQFPRYTSYLEPMEVTAAHEYNHVLQFGYDVFQDTWFLESTAVWMEDVVYDDVNDYLSYVGPWTQITQVPMTSFDELDETDPMNVKAYGDAVWERWVQSHYGQRVIRNAWERSTSTIPASFAPGALDAALHARGSSFFGAFTRFAADSAEWRSTVGPFHDRDAALWPDVQRASQRTLAPGADPISGQLDHTTFALVDVAPTHDARVKLVGSFPDGTAAALALVGRRGPDDSGTVEVALRRLPHGGSGSIALDDPGRFSRITAVLVNADTRPHGYSGTTGDWNFLRDGQAVKAHVSNRFAPLRLAGRSPGPGARVGRSARVVLRFSAAVDRRSLDLLRLRDSGGKRVAVKAVRDRGGTRVTLVPRKRLRGGARYSVSLGARIVDVDRNPLVGAHGWSFKTRR